MKNQHMCSYRPSRALRVGLQYFRLIINELFSKVDGFEELYFHFQLAFLGTRFVCDMRSKISDAIFH